MDFLAGIVALADRSAFSSPVSSLWLFLGVGVMVRLLSRGSRPDGPACPAVRNIDDQRRALDCEPHEFGPVRVCDFRWLDEARYDEAQQELETAGFRCFGDVEDLSLSAVFPEMRTAIRDMASGDGVVAASVWQASEMNWLRARIAGDRVVELQTEFSDRSFVATTNAPETGGQPGVPGLELMRLASATSVGRLLAAHRARVGRVLAGKPGIAPVLIRTHREMRRSAERAHALRCEAKSGTGFAPVRSAAGAGSMVADPAPDLPVPAIKLSPGMSQANHAASSAG